MRIVYTIRHRTSVEFFIGKDHFVYLNIETHLQRDSAVVGRKRAVERTSVMPEDVASIQIVKQVVSFKWIPKYSRRNRKSCRRFESGK